MDQKITRAGRVKLPAQAVQLQYLLDDEDNSVVVHCNAVDDLVMLEATRGLPGAHVPDENEMTAEQKDSPEGKAAQAARDEEEARQMMAVAPIVFEQGTALAGEDGALIRPAFYVGDVPPHPFAIPFRYLRVTDVQRMFNAILSLGRYVGGPASPGAFPARDRAGADGVRGDMGAVPGGGENAVGSGDGPA